MKGLILLFKFMTRLPIPVNPEFDSKELGKSMKLFPVVGIVVGLVLYVVYFLGAKFILSSYLLAAVVVLAEVVLTGGLHLDGLADTFDGIFSYRSKQKMLEIMKDSRLGTNGGIALILYFVLKILLLAGIMDTGFGAAGKFLGLKDTAGAVILITPVLARINPVLNCAFSPYARAAGSAKDFVDCTDKSGVLIAAATGLLFSAVVGCGILGNLNPVHLINITAVTMILGLYFSKLMERKIGGITGDTLGAILELSEIIILFGFYFSVVSSIGAKFSI